MNNSQRRRLWLVIIGLIFATTIIVGRLVAFQIIQGETWAERTSDTVRVIAQPKRGTIYDRNGTVIAANGADYSIGASPDLVYQSTELATALAPILQRPTYEILGALESEQKFVMLEGRVSDDIAEAVRELPYNGLQIDPLARRFYPQGELMCHTIGHVDYENVGGGGIEGYYQQELAGEAASAEINISPLTPQENVIAREGADLVLTIDRTVQYTVEKHLIQALREHGAPTGTIVVMNPKTGAVLGMASAPCYDPYVFFEADETLLFNPLVSQQFEPGSVMKLITMAAALDAGVVTPNSTYYDSGTLEVGGHRTVNWDRSAPGTVDMTTLLARSLNVGAATLSTWMGPESYYNYMQAFGFGRPTGIDILSEATGLMPLPGDSNWTESFLATNSYGQGLAVTSLQMTAAISALANDGYLMQPYVVEEVHTPQGTRRHEPTVLSRPIRPEIAQQMTNMAITAVAREVSEAHVEGYTIAGKTGTAQIPENGIYHPTDVIGSFVGWLPADNPEIVVFVKIDRPTSAPWGSKTAAPTFAKLVEELVILLNIPPDNVRLQADILAARPNP
ncbi:MAG: penicillin-binding protein 2 [Chloroflexota bacterium]